MPTGVPTTPLPTMTPTASYSCLDAYSCEGSSLVTTSEDLECYGSFSCWNSALLVSIGRGNIQCYGSYSCYNSLLIRANNTAGGFIDCRGLSSCSEVAELRIDEGFIGCRGERSCYGSTIIAYTINCYSDRSCANSVINTTYTVFVEGHLAGANTTFYSVGSSGYYYFYGGFSAYNATIICGMCFYFVLLFSLCFLCFLFFVFLFFFLLVFCVFYCFFGSIYFAV